MKIFGRVINGWLVLGLIQGSVAQAGTGVQPVQMKSLLLKEPVMADLHGKQLRFHPAQGDYRLEVGKAPKLGEDHGPELPISGRQGTWFAYSWKVDLPFAFPFGGKEWKQLFVSKHGAITFEKSEADMWSEPGRNLWATGGMISLVSALVIRAHDQKERGIAAFWGDFQDARVYVAPAGDTVTITWDATHKDPIRPSGPPVPDADKPDRRSLFQARLHKNGQVELRYPRLEERVGIVGLFTGQPVKAQALDQLPGMPTQSAHPSTQISKVQMFEEGALLRFAMTVEGDVAEKLAQGQASYRVFLRTNERTCEVSVSVTAQGRSSGNNCLEAPSPSSFRVEGKTVHIIVPKYVAGDLKTFEYWADAVWWGGPQGAFSQLNMQQPRKFQTAKYRVKDVHLSRANGRTTAGSVFQAFHYTLVDRNALNYIAAARKYGGVKDKEDMAVTFLDFLIDDLWGMAGGSLSYNFPIQGLGAPLAQSWSTEWTGNDKLYSSMQTISAPHFLSAPSGQFDDGSTFRNHMPLLRLVDHELNHRWGMQFTLKHPETGALMRLTGYEGHWLEGMHVPSVARVWKQYSDQEYVEQSNMGGSFWIENPDGTFTRKGKPYHAATGYAALDMYAFGLLPAGEVPDTFFIEDLKPLGGDKYSGKKVVVRIQDVIAAQGSRAPASAEAPKEFKLRVYLFHRGKSPKHLKRVESAAAAIRAHYPLASGGRWKFVD